MAALIGPDCACTMYGPLCREQGSLRIIQYVYRTNRTRVGTDTVVDVRTYVRTEQYPLLSLPDNAPLLGTDAL